MKKSNISFIVVILIFVVSGVLSWNLYFKVYTQSDTVDIKKFPMTIGDWVAEDLPLTKREIEILETDNVFARRYTNPLGEEVYILIVYSQNNRKVSHPPEICYTGSGAVILSDHLDSMPVGDGQAIDAHRLTVEIGKFKQSVFYWFKVGDTYTANYWKQQGLIAVKSFLGQPASSALIRISANYKSDEQMAIQRVKSFAKLMYPHLKTYLP